MLYEQEMKCVKQIIRASLACRLGKDKIHTKLNILPGFLVLPRAKYIKPMWSSILAKRFKCSLLSHLMPICAYLHWHITKAMHQVTGNHLPHKARALCEASQPMYISTLKIISWGMVHVNFSNCGQNITEHFNMVTPPGHPHISAIQLKMLPSSSYNLNDNFFKGWSGYERHKVIKPNNVRWIYFFLVYTVQII